MGGWKRRKKSSHLGLVSSSSSLVPSPTREEEGVFPTLHRSLLVARAAGEEERVFSAFNGSLERVGGWVGGWVVRCVVEQAVGGLTVFRVQGGWVGGGGGGEETYLLVLSDGGLVAGEAQRLLVSFFLRSLLSE